jgi:hypothetical protein
MSEIWLPQSEADRLISIPKKRLDDKEHIFPPLNIKYKLDLVSLDGKERFELDMSCSSKSVQKLKLQKRSHGTIVLVRLDIHGAPHRNPDGEEFPCPHIHTYKEGFGDSWATPIDRNVFPDTDDHWRTISDFFKYCMVVNPPILTKALLS